MTNSGSNTVSVFLNNGSGVFSDKTDLITGSVPYNVSIRDFNGDTKSDLAIVNKTSKSLSILLGNGIGGFSAKTDFTMGSTNSNPVLSQVGDLNSDNRCDLVIANDNTTGSISLFSNNAIPI